MAGKSFDIFSYDCIGFDLDNTLAKFKVGAMVEMEYEIISKFLIKKGYSEKHLSKPLDYDFLLKGLILDMDKGNILKVANDGMILSASHGTNILSTKEIEKYYPNFHWELTDVFIKDPLKVWNGPNHERIYSLLDYFDIVVSLIFARMIDSLDEKYGGPSESYLSCFKDILECLEDMFTINNFRLEKGEYYPEMKANPEKYYYKSSEKLIQLLKSLKNKKKLVFLITGSYVDFASLTASNTLGIDWKEYFDIIITYAKKPGFFSSKREFIGLDGVNITEPVSFEKLKLGGIYTQGNWEDLCKFLIKHSIEPNPKFLYVGDNMIQDIYAPSVYTHCDTVAICEELYTEENHYGHYPEEIVLKSTVWGSYFRQSNVDTIWYKIIKDYSKLCIPCVELLLQIPYEKNDM